MINKKTARELWEEYKEIRQNEKDLSFKWENGSINDNIVRFAKDYEINNNTIDVYIEL